MGVCIPNKGKTVSPGDGDPKAAGDLNGSKMDVDAVFEDLGDMKDNNIDSKMLLSETNGKPKEIYETIQNITSIATGVIKQVKHRETKRTRAMKLIRRDLIEAKEEETFLFKELALLRSLDHPNIVKLYEFYRDEKNYCLISEFCERGELFNIIKKQQGGFPEYSVAFIMKQLLSVVCFCHDSNIINRDLRPENILVESEEKEKIDGEEYVFYNIRVNDFKSARTFKHSKKLNKKVGNPYYIAPEVLKRKYNEKCDIWSCGIIMYVLLVGKPPFSGSSDKEILEKVESGTLEYFEKDMDKVSAEARSLLSDLLKIDPNKRSSALDALKHKFFVKYERPFMINKATIQDCFDSFCSFSPELKFQQAALAYIVHHVIDIEDVRHLRKIFEAFDSDKNGKLSHHEIMAGFRDKCGVQLVEKEFMKIIRRIDQDKSKFIDYEEFIRAAMNKDVLLSEANLSIAFRLFDLDGGGEISSQELKTIMGLNAKFSNHVWNEIISQFEINNPEINYDEFKNLMSKLKN